MDFIGSIIVKFPELTRDDISLVDHSDGKGMQISKWNSAKPKPLMEDVKRWNDEDNANQPPPQPSIEEQLAAKDDQIRELKAYTQQLNDDLAALADYVTGGGM